MAVLNGLPVLSRGTGPPRLAMPDAGPSAVGLTNLLVHSIAYTGEALVTVDTRCAVDATPAAIRLSTTFACEVLQGRCSQIRFALPPGQTLTKLSGDLIKDWQATSEEGVSIIMVDFIRPLEGQEQSPADQFAQ